MRRLPILLLFVGALWLLMQPGRAIAESPSNDNFADARVIASLPFSNVAGITEATTEPDEPGVDMYGPGKTVWYSFTPTSDLMLRADLGGSDYVSAFMSVYRADPDSPGFGGLTWIAGGSYGPSFAFQLEAGKTYYIQEGDSAAYWGWVSTIGINLQVVNPPPNDNFADATAVTSVPFSDNPDLTAATVESGEPMACGTSLTQSVWYAFTPTTSGSYGSPYPMVNSVNVYTGTSLSNLTNVACSGWYGLYFWAEAGTTYYLQSTAGLSLVLVPPPAAAFVYSPGDPSGFDDVTFSYTNWGYIDPTVNDWAWDLGDGTTATGNSSVSHRFPRDGDYTVTLTVYALGGRSATQTQTVQVRTHDVTILSLAAPTKGMVGRTGVITAGVGNVRYPETVQLDIYKSTSHGDYVLVDTGIQAVGVMKPKKAIQFSFNYTFTNDDLAAGKVGFKAVATIQGARDAVNGDNEATSTPTLVTK